MSRSSKSGRPRKAYRPRAVDPHAHLRAITYTRRIDAADAARQVALLNDALAAFMRGHDCPQHWRSLADCANVAESLSLLGIGSNAEADRIVHEAQVALSAVATRRQQRGSWTLYAAEIDALQWLLALHKAQLEAADYFEFDRALAATKRRISQAVAGNAPAGAVIVEGEIA